MRQNEKYKRLVKLLFSLVQISLLVSLYSFLWVGYYNKVILYPFFRRGNWMVIFIYMVLLAFFMQLYGGFKVGYLRKGNLIYSQILSAFFTNVITYLQIAVLNKAFMSPLPLVGLLIVQGVVVVIWTTAFQWIYSSLFPPRRMLLITGDRSDYHLREKIDARDDKYIIEKTVNYRRGMERLIPDIQKSDGVIIGDMPSHERNMILKYCFQNSIRSYSVPKISDILLKSSDELNLFDSPLLLSRNIGLSIEQLFVKRLIDIIGSSIGILISLPFFLIIGISIKLTDGGPVFYTQTRLTKDGKPFQIYKFRTMVQNAEKDGIPRLAAEGDARILPVGRILRRTRLDELPQIYNIFKGDMSLVGPRPERPELVEEFTAEIPEFPSRMKVKAGLTGYAQVYGKYNTTPYDKLKLDLTYIRNYSVFLDLKLIFMTPKILFLRESTEGVQQ